MDQDGTFLGRSHTLKSWAEEMKEELIGKEIVWEPLQGCLMHYIDGYFGRPPVLAEIIYFVPFSQAQQKEFLELIK